MGDAVASRRGRRRIEERTAAHCPHRMPAATRRTWLPRVGRTAGARAKLLALLRRVIPRSAWPTRSMVNALLDREGLSDKQRRRRGPRVIWRGPLQTTAPNQVWPIDFKGQFKIARRRLVLSADGHRPFQPPLLLCEALASTRTTEVQPEAAAALKPLGVLDATGTDNGVPFASTACTA